MLTRLTRLAAIPWLRLSLLAVVLAFCGYTLAREWPQVTASLGRLHWYTLAGALAAAMAGSCCMMLAWRGILADLGSALPVGAAARVNFIAQLAKYVPGAVWAFAVQVELGHDYQVPRRRSLASVVTSLTLMVASGVGIALATLPVTSPGVVRQYWWIVCTVPVLAIVLCPPVLGRILDRLLVLLRFQPLERRPGWRSLGRAVAWNLAGWLMLGTAVWLLAGEMATHRPPSLLLAAGGYALAYAAGMVMVVLPSGLGVRELILVAALSEVMPHGTAVAVALVTRVVTTLSDLALGGLGIALGRSPAFQPGTDRRSIAVESALQPSADADQAGLGQAGTAPPSKSSSLSSS